MNSFSTWTSPPTSPISTETSLYVYSPHDHILPSFDLETRWDPMGNQNEWPFTNNLENQVHGEHHYLEYHQRTEKTIPNSCVLTDKNYDSKAWKNWELHKGTKRDSQVTKAIQKEPKQGTPRPKKSPKEQPDQEASQNKRRNMPGLVFEAMVKECREDQNFLKENQKKLKDFVTSEFLSQLKNYRTNQKTFSSVALFAIQTFDQGLNSLILVTEFVQSEQRYYRWLSQSKMSLEQKALFNNEGERSLLQRKFEVVKEEVQKCLEDFKTGENEDLVQIWNKSYSPSLTKKIRDQNFQS